tara:strand:+ start:491 stop:1336 length:846 start_codon:yes stop_codon:yes gene_type:complete
MIVRKTVKTLFRKQQGSYKPGTRNYRFVKKEILELEKVAKNKNNRAKLDRGEFIVDSKLVHPTYSINDYGFRCDKFHKKSTGIVTLGCSDTFGEYQFLEKTWPYLVASHLNQQCWNLASCGGDIGINYINLLRYSKFIKFDKVFILIPSPTREVYYKDYGSKLYTRQFLTIDKYYRQVKQKYNTSDKILKELHYHDLSKVDNDLNRMFYINSYLEAIQGHAKKNNAEVYFIPSINYYKKDTIVVKDFPDKQKTYNLACDLVHAGSTFQKEIADSFIKKLRN